MPTSRNTTRLPVELLIYVFREAARSAVLRDNKWLASLAMTSRLVWTVVRPILYHTVVITASNLPNLHAALAIGNLALTKRVLCRIQVRPGERHPLRDVCDMADAFSNVEYFSGREADHFMLRHLSETVFSPSHATLVLSDYFMSVKSIIRSAHAQTNRGITHLHVVINLYSPVWPAGVPRPDSEVLSHVILEPQMDHWSERLLTSEVLPFLLSYPSMERVLVRAPRDKECREQTWLALDDFVRSCADSEERVWISDVPTDPERSVFDIDAAFDTAKWSAGRPVLRSLFADRP